MTELTRTAASLAEATELLRQARKHRNETVNDRAELDAWHSEVDYFLRGEGVDEPEEELIWPARQQHRELVDRMFR